MKTIQTVFKANIKASIIMLLLLMIGITSCKKDDDPVIQPIVTITPEEEEEEVVLSDEKEITEFKFLATENTVLIADVVAAIDINAMTITANLPSDIPLIALTPKISSSPKATVSPAGINDFTAAAIYTVTAEDGTTSSYAVTVTSNSSAKEIISFVFTGIEYNGVINEILGEINEEDKTIILDMPGGTEVSSLEPVLEISSQAVYEPTGPQVFSTPINYTITAEDGTSTTYLVTVNVPPSQKEILLSITEANPNNTLNWNELEHLSDWDGVTLDENGFVLALDLGSKNLISLPSEIGQLSNLEFLLLPNNNLSSLPSEIGQLRSLKTLNLMFNNLSSLPSEITQLKNLENLWLNNNNLSEFNHVPYENSGNSNILNCSAETNLISLTLFDNPNLTALNQCICDLDVDNSGAVDIDIVPDHVDCIDNNVIGN